jgi:hypothetical protein
MAEAVLNLTNKSIDQKADKTDVIVQKMGDNAVTYPTPDPPLATLTAKATALRNKKAAAAAAKLVWRDAVNEQDAAEAALDEDLKTELRYIQTASGGDKDKIEAGGVDVKKEGTENSTPAKVQNLSLSHGDNDGDVDMHWNAVKKQGVKTYQYRVSNNYNSPVETWAIGEEVTSKTTLTGHGFPTGQRIWIEVRAVNAAGHGPWSDPATIVVD